MNDQMKEPIQVLLIEDSERDRELIRTRLENSPRTYTIREVPTLTAGVDEMRREEPDAVLLDLALPDSLSLDDALARIKSVRKKAAIVIVSGYVTPDKTASLILGTASACVEKSHLELLDREIGYAIASHRACAMLDKATQRKEEAMRVEGS